jgi:hypothetical protein
MYLGFFMEFPDLCTWGSLWSFVMYVPGFFMVFPDVCLWGFRRTYLRFSMFKSGFSMGYLMYVYGILDVHIWDLYGVFDVRICCSLWDS